MNDTNIMIFAKIGILLHGYNNIYENTLVTGFEGVDCRL